MKTVSFIIPSRQLPQSLCKHGYETGISDALLHYCVARPPHTHLALKAIHSIPSKARVTHTKKSLSSKNKIIPIKLYREFSASKTLLLRQYIIHHKQISRYFIHSCGSNAEIAVPEFALEQTITGTLTNNDNKKAIILLHLPNKNHTPKIHEKNHTHKPFRFSTTAKGKEKQFCYISASPLYLTCSTTLQIWLLKKRHK